jgi:hypothetical protein
MNILFVVFISYIAKMGLLMGIVGFFINWLTQPTISIDCFDPIDGMTRLNAIYKKNIRRIVDRLKDNELVKDGGHISDQEIDEICEKNINKYSEKLTDICTNSEFISLNFTITYELQNGINLIVDEINNLIEEKCKNGHILKCPNKIGVHVGENSANIYNATDFDLIINHPWYFQ